MLTRSQFLYVIVWCLPALVHRIKLRVGCFSLGHGFYHLSCCSPAPRCPWNVHGSKGLSLYALCVFGCDLGDRWSCLLLPWLRTGSRFDRFLHLLACPRLRHCSLLLERTWKAMLDTSMRIHVRVTLECLLGIMVYLFESPTVVGTADVAKSRTRELLKTYSASHTHLYPLPRSLQPCKVPPLVGLPLTNEEKPFPVFPLLRPFF